MKSALSILLLLSATATATASAQQYAANDYRVCPNPQTQRGLTVVESACGKITPPDFVPGSITSLSELQAAEQSRDAFKQRVADYGTCITSFINSYRRPGADATSTAPDEAACAHAWAEDQVTQTVIDYGRTCVEFSNLSMMDSRIQPWSGECYPAVDQSGGQG